MDKLDFDVSREELVRRWAAAEERIKAQESELRRRTDMEREIGESRAENAILKGQLEKLSGEVKLKNEQISELFRKWQNGNMTFLLKENGDLARKWRAAEDKAEESKQILQATQNTLTDREHQLSNSNRQVQEKDSQIAILVRKLEELKAENSRLQAELQQLHSEGIAQLEEKIKEISVMRENHERQEQKLKSEIQSMEMGYQEKDIELQKLSLQLGQFKMQFQQECIRLQDENQGMRDQLQDAKIPVVERPVFKDTPSAHPSASDYPGSLLPEGEVSRDAAKRVLLVESSSESVYMISNALSKAGYLVATADTADQILSACRNLSVDLLLMNIVVNDLDVYGLSLQLAQDPLARKVPFILMASNPEATEVFRQEGQYSIKSFLYKPFSLKELLSTIDYVLAAGS